MKKLLPVILALIGLGGGVGAGIMLKPAPVDVSEMGPCGPDDVHTASAAKADEAEDDDAAPMEYLKLSNQFIVPLVKDGNVHSLVLLSLSVEIMPETRDAVFQREPKLRDVFLQVLFDHANSGGFDGNFTSGLKMSSLRTSLMEVAQQVIGDRITDILVTDIIRQEA